MHPNQQKKPEKTDRISAQWALADLRDSTRLLTRRLDTLERRTVSAQQRIDRTSINPPKGTPTP
jgi:hypothetical protein